MIFLWSATIIWWWFFPRVSPMVFRAASLRANPSLALAWVERQERIHQMALLWLCKGKNSFSPCAFVKYSHKKSWNKILIALPRATVTSCVRCRYIRYKWQGTSGSKWLIFLLIWSLLRSFLLSVSCVDILWFVSLFVPCQSYFKVGQLACEVWFYVSVQSLLNKKVFKC